MAYLSNWQDDDKDPNAADGKQNTSGIVDGSTSVTPTSGAPAANTSQAPAPGTGFVNLQSYLDQNKGEGGRLATDTTKDVANEADGYAGKAQGVVSDAASGFKAASGDDKAATINSGIANNAASTQSAAKDFLGAGYSGPLATDKSAGLAADKSSLDSRLGSVDNADTQAGALNDTYGKAGNYTQGFGLLDRFLMQGDQSGRDKTAEVKGKAAGVDSAYTDANNSLTTGEQAARNQLAANQKSVTTTAAQTQAQILKAAQDKQAALNAGLDPSHYDGTSQANLADGISHLDPSGGKLHDLEALSAIQNGKTGDWYTGAYNAGTAKPAPAPVAPQPTDSGKGPLDQITKPVAAVAKAGADTSDTSKKAGSDVAAMPHQNQGTPINLNPAGAVQHAAGVIAAAAPKLKKPSFKH